MKISSNAVGDSNDEDNFVRKLLLTNQYTSFKARKTFSNNSSPDVSLSKPQLHKIGQSGVSLGLLLSTGLLLLGNVLKPLNKCALIPLGSTVSATNAAIHRKCLNPVLQHC